MGPPDVQGMLLVAFALVFIAAFIALTVPRAEPRLRRENMRLQRQLAGQKERINALNHDLYCMQGVVEQVKPAYERARRLKDAIAEMKRVWLAPDSNTGECERVLRENLWVLAPDYRQVRLMAPGAQASTLSAAALCGTVPGRPDVPEPVHLLIDLKPFPVVTRTALEEAHAHAFGLMQHKAPQLAGPRIECLVIGPAVAPGASDVRLSWGSEAPGSIRIRPLSFADLIARAELLANPPVDPLEPRIISLAKERAARLAA